MSDDIEWLDESEQVDDIEQEILRYERHMQGFAPLSATEVEEIIEWICSCSPYTYDAHTCQFVYIDWRDDDDEG